MKKTRLLVSTLTLSLALTLGACGLITIDGSISEETLSELTSEQETTSESTKSTDKSVGTASNPLELVGLANETGNYSVEIVVDDYMSKDTVTADEYENATNYDQEAVTKYYGLFENMSLSNELIYEIYYDNDYVYLELYQYYMGKYYLVLTEILLNTSTGLWEYYTYNLQSWTYLPDYYFSSFGINVWQDNASSLFKAKEKGTASYLKYYPDYDVYDFTDWTGSYWIYGTDYGYVSEASADWFTALGGEFVFGTDAYNYTYYYCKHDVTYFSLLEQTLQSIYRFQYHGYTDESQSYVYAGEQDIYLTVYDVGKTDKSETVYYYHNILQGLLS